MSECLRNPPQSSLHSIRGSVAYSPFRLVMLVGRYANNMHVGSPMHRINQAFWSMTQALDPQLAQHPPTVPTSLTGPARANPPTSSVECAPTIMMNATPAQHGGTVTGTAAPQHRPSQPESPSMLPGSAPPTPPLSPLDCIPRVNWPATPDQPYHCTHHSAPRHECVDNNLPLPSPSAAVKLEEGSFTFHQRYAMPVSDPPYEE